MSNRSDSDIYEINKQIVDEFITIERELDLAIEEGMRIITKCKVLQIKINFIIKSMENEIHAK